MLIGFPIGLGISALLCALAGWVIRFEPVYCGALIGICALIFWLMAKRSQDRNENLQGRKVQADASLLYFMGIIAALIVVSYSSFGAKTPQGYAFKDLYATDLLHHMSVFVQLPNGIPPANPYFSGQPWHYYWVSHILPAFIYATSGFLLAPRDIMLTISVAYALIFIGALFFFIGSCHEDKKIVIWVMILSLFAFGYNDLFVFFKYCVLMFPQSVIQHFHLDYLISDARGEQFTGYSHGWFRNFLVEPHSTLAISILFVVILLVKREGILIFERHRSLFRGLLLGMIFSVDAFVGVIAICWYALATMFEVFKAKAPVFKSGYSMIWVFLPIGLIFMFLYFLKIISPGSSHLILKPDVRMIILSPLYYVIDYGPMGILGASGIYLLTRNGDISHHRAFVLLVATCLFFMFFVNLSPVGSTQMFRKAGMVIRIPLILFSGICLQYIYRNARASKLVPLLFLSTVIALPTPLIDMYKLSNWETGASFIKQEDMEAQRWIRASLPHDSIVQDFPTDVTPIVAFGERRVALGDWEHANSSGIVTEKIAERFKEVRRLFETKDPNEALQIAQELSINFIYVNQYTRDQFAEGSRKFDIQTNQFRKVYSEQGVSIYKVGA